ncbi:hypothetical protein POTOM_010141 [Populus tomentosa]|uniref:ZCF37 n=1 Tax=Populus tomentosa TaxID=118781 RepID=A0A8X8DAQ1_POPTO|nr:hypothetical protein POTOM_010141 [Populus tomentosa]
MELHHVVEETLQDDDASNNDRNTAGNQELEDEPWNSPSSTPKRSRPSATPKRSSPSATPPRKSRKSSKNNKNPYSSRGLDKFSALLAELEEKRQKIYTKIGPEDVSVVRFVYSSSNDCIPVIVKAKDQKQDKPRASGVDDVKDKPINHNSTEVVDKLPTPAPAETKQAEQPRLEADKKTEKKCFTWSFKLHRWRRPYYYMPVAIVLILLLLVFFGRSVAILWTSLGWYIVPTLSTKKPSKKTEDVRRLREPKMVINHGVSSPKRKSTGAITDKLPQRHEQRKSF